MERAKFVLALPCQFVEVAVNPMNQNVPAPAVLDGLSDIPFTLDWSLTLSSKTQLWNHGICAAACCTIRLVGPSLGKGPHVLEVSRGESFHSGKLSPQVRCQAIDDLCTPAMLLLPGKDVPANLPVKQDEFPVDRDRCSELCGAESGLSVVRGIARSPLE